MRHGSRAIAVRVASLARSTEWSLRIKPVYITLHLHAHQGRICVLIDPFSLPSPAPRSPDVAKPSCQDGGSPRTEHLLR